MSSAVRNDDDAVTQVLVRLPAVNVASDDAIAATPADSRIQDRPTLPEAMARDTIVDSAPAPALARLGDWLCSVGRSFLNAFVRPRLSDHLPPLPPRHGSETTQLSAGVMSDEERGERLLLDVMRAPEQYVAAAILIAKATQALHRGGDPLFATGVVAFALSRMHPDANGTVSIRRLRERLRDMPFARNLTDALLRLEEEGVVALESRDDDAPRCGISDWDDICIRLLVEP